MYRRSGVTGPTRFRRDGDRDGLVALCQSRLEHCRGRGTNIYHELWSNNEMVVLETQPFTVVFVFPAAVDGIVLVRDWSLGSQSRLPPTRHGRVTEKPLATLCDIDRVRAM